MNIFYSSGNMSLAVTDPRTNVQKSGLNFDFIECNGQFLCLSVVS